MFKNEYQGGLFVEIFSAHGRDPVAKWKLPSSGLEKEFDKEAKSFIIKLDGSSSVTKMSLPKDPKQSLTLLQRYLVIQCFVPLGNEFSIELAVTDLSSIKKRLLLSTSFKEVFKTPLHVKIPLVILRRGLWTNLCLDLVSMVADTWKGQDFRSLDAISVSATCKVKRLFTLKSQPFDTSNDDQLYGVDVNQNHDTALLPKAVGMHSDVLTITQVVDMNKVNAAERASSGQTTALASTMSALEITGRRKSGMARKQRASPTEAKSKFAPEATPKRSASHEKPETLPKDARNGEAKTERKSRLPRLVGRGSGFARVRSASKENEATPPLATDRPTLKKVGSEPIVNGLSLQGQPLETPRLRLSRSDSGKDAAAASMLASPRTARGKNLFLFSCPPKQRHPSPCWTEPPRGSPEDAVGGGGDDFSRPRPEISSVGSSSSRRGSYAKPEDDFRLENASDDENVDPLEALKKRPRVPSIVRRQRGHERASPRGVERRSRRGSSQEVVVSSEAAAAAATTTRLAPTGLPRPRFVAGPVYQTSDSEEEARKREEEYEEARDYEEILKRSLEAEEGMEERGVAEGAAESTTTAPRIEINVEGPPMAYIPRPDLTDTFEAEMLASLKRQQQEEYAESASPSPRRVAPEIAQELKTRNKEKDSKRNRKIGKGDKALETTSESGIDDSRDSNSMLSTDSIEKHVYHDESDSDNSDDTTLSTLKPPPQPSKYNYEGEMHMGASLMLPNDTLLVRSSNPRDWGNLFSPPVTLREGTELDNSEKEKDSESKVEEKKVSRPLSLKQEKPSSKTSDDNEAESDEILELMFDPVLNCYFDPKTNKYYELC